MATTKLKSGAIKPAKTLNLWTAEFVDSTEEEAYRLQSAARQRSALLTLCALCIFAAPIQIIGAWPNVEGNPLAIQGLIVQRGTSALIYALLLLAIFSVDRYISLERFAFFASCLLLYNVFSIQEFSTGDGLGLVFRGVLVMLLVVFMLELRFSYFIIIYLVLGAEFIHQFSYFLDLSGSDTSTAIVSIVFLLVVGIIHRWQQERQRRTFYALNNTLVDLHLELENANEQLEKLAHTDALTGLANRREYDRFLHIEDHRSKRTKRNYALAIIDIDHFKLINDTHGHAVGDLVLTRLAMAFTDNSRGYELVARIGGDEFAIIVSEIGDEQIVAKLNSLRKIIQNTNFEDIGDGLSCTISIGIAISSVEKSIAEIQKAADQALYRAKDNGRNQVIFYGTEFPV